MDLLVGRASLAGERRVVAETLHTRNNKTANKYLWLARRAATRFKTPPVKLLKLIREVW